MNQRGASESATLAGGCFWCIEAVFLEVDGVSEVVSGYTGGTTADPTYQQVCMGDTGHAEAVQVVFNPVAVSYRDILNIFFSIHDPTTLNRQGPDAGPQYRSAIFYHNEMQKRTAEEVIEELGKARLWKSRIVTQVAPLDVFYPAEDYHQQYFLRNTDAPYCQFLISPKLSKFRKEWANRRKP